MSRRRSAVVTVAGVVAVAIALGTTACSTGDAQNRHVDPSATISHARGLVRPGAVHIGRSTVAEARPIVLRAQELYTFWDTGDAAWLHRAVDPTFRDRTLPVGRPQGPAGPPAASAQFREAVTDLRCRLDDLYVTGDTFTARLTFTGHFTGTSGGTQGSGQRIDFGAIDIQHVGASGRITEDWHLEDNLTFMQQAGLVPVDRP